MSEKQSAKARTHFYAPQMIALGFLWIILLGAVLLTLPWASASRESVGFFDALFTATSAVCVTGLTVVETGAVYSLFGQIVLLCLIQIGGLGFVTIVTLVFVSLGRKITLSERILIQEAMNENNIGGMVRLILWVIRLTAVCEGAGAVLLSLRFIPRFGWGKGIFYSIFHAVSAFCNAGFDVLGNGDSFCAFATDPLVLLTLGALVAVGGLGFGVIHDLTHQRGNGRLRLHTKITLVMTGMLLGIGVALILVAEWNNPATLGDMTVPQKLLAALFQSITFRTAGFAAVPQGLLRPASKFAGSVLMFLGAAPASTGGGIKITTLAVLAILALSTIHGREECSAFGRTLPRTLLQRAVSILMIAAAVLFLDVTVLTLLHPELDFADALFECASALGTAGLTAAGTSGLSRAAQSILMITMYIGRIGPLSLTVAIARRQDRKGKSIKLPEERVIVG